MLVDGATADGAPHRQALNEELALILEPTLLRVRVRLVCD
jgi:hypothetical protein